MQAPAPMTVMARRLAPVEPVWGSVGSFSGTLIATPFAAGPRRRCARWAAPSGSGRSPAAVGGSTSSTRVAGAGGAGIGRPRGPAPPAGGHAGDRSVDARHRAVLYGGADAVTRPATRGRGAATAVSAGGQRAGSGS